MGRKYHKPSKDVNHPDIVKALKAVGAVVIDTTPVKHAFDILVAYRGDLFIMEIKNPETLPKKYDENRLLDSLTEGEKECRSNLLNVGINYYIVTNETQALEIIGAIKPK